MIFHSKEYLYNYTACRRNKIFLYAVFFAFILLTSNTNAVEDSLFKSKIDVVNTITDRVLSSNMINASYAALPLFTQAVMYKIHDVNYRDMRNEFLFNFDYEYDTYIQVLPLGLTYALKSFGFQSRSSWSELITANILTLGIGTGIVHTIKGNIKELRPDGSAYNSFPSGHTTLAFMCASILSKEYKEKYPYLSILGYTTAAVTGLSRITNNRHWIQDIYAGAGIGILATEFSYHLTDIIFNEHHNEDFHTTMQDTKEMKPHFADFFLCYDYTHFNNPQRLNNGTEYSLHNGVSIGMESAYFFTPNIGLHVKSKITSFEVENQNIWWPEDSIFYIHTLELGPMVSYPILNRVLLGFRIGTGITHIHNDQLQDDVPIVEQTKFTYSFGPSVTLWMDEHAFCRFFADYYYTKLKFEDVVHNFPYVSIGMSVALHF